MSVKISSLELENVKRIRAVELEPTKDGLTVIGGKNAQGKTSVLDAIAWALGGDKLKPDDPNRKGGATPAKLHIELDNGVVVERKGFQHPGFWTFEQASHMMSRLAMNRWVVPRDIDPETYDPNN